MTSRTRAPKPRDPAAEHFNRDLAKLRFKAVEVVKASFELAGDFEEAYEYGHSNSQRGDVIGGRGSGFEDVDPTHAIATSWDHVRVRGAASFTARAVRRAERQLDKALEALHDCWLDIDPDLKRDRMDRRARAREATEET